MDYSHTLPCDMRIVVNLENGGPRIVSPNVVLSFHSLVWSLARSGIAPSRFHDRFSPVILHDLLHHRKSQAGTILFPVTHKRMKKLVANRFCDSGTVVGNRNRDRLLVMADRDPYPAVTAGCCLASVQQEIVKGTLEFARIEPGQACTIAVDLNEGSLMARMQTNSLHSSLHSFHNAGITGAEGFSGSGKLEQRIDEVGHLVHTDANLLIQL